MKSDVMEEHEYNGVRTEEKFCVRPGLFCGLITWATPRSPRPRSGSAAGWAGAHR